MAPVSVPSGLRPALLPLPLLVPALLLAAGCSDATGPDGTSDDPVVAVSAGHAHSCALRRSGAAWCWGLNRDGRVGDGATADVSDPARVATDRSLRLIDASSASTWALTEDGAVLHWGDGVPAPTPLETAVSFREIRADWGVCGLDASGRGYCWGGMPGWWFGGEGAGVASEPTPAYGGRTLAQIVPGLDRTCAVDTDGVVWCAGYNDQGQLGNGTFATADTATRIDDTSRYRSVALGFAATCGLTVEGVVKCWGANESGQLGIGGLGDPVPTPTPVAGDLRFTELSAGGDRVCGITVEDQVRCWGWGGVRTSDQKPGEPNLFGIGRPFHGVTTGTYHSCALSLEDGGVYCWGSNRAGQLGRGGTGAGGEEMVRVQLPLP